MFKVENLFNTKDENELSEREQRELINMVNQGSNFRTNKEIFEEVEKNLKTCARYNPCPICNKCLNKASHLYVKCEVCKIPICVHTNRDRVFMIRRDNFEIKVDKKTILKLRKISEKVEK